MRNTMKIVNNIIKTHVIDYMINNVYHKWNQSIKKYNHITYNLINADGIYLLYTQTDNEYRMIAIIEEHIQQYSSKGIIITTSLGIRLNEKYGNDCIKCYINRLRYGTCHEIPWENIYEAILMDKQ